jgi:hydrogenase maturation factor
MEKLSETAQANILKMSDARLVVKLQHVGFATEDIEEMDRQAMLEAWAEIVF